MYERVPDALKRMRHWVCHKFPDKAPRRTRANDRGELTLASCSNPATWGTFEEAIRQVEEGRAEGVGFQLGNGIVGIDIDHCVDGGEASALAQGILDELRSYAEVSPSGTGIHILCRGKLPGPGRKKPILGLEMYDSSRYFTVTGDVYLAVDGQQYQLRDCQPELNALYEKYFSEDPPEQTKLGARNTARPAPSPVSPPSPAEQGVRELSDQEIIEIAYKSEGGDKFRRLYEGSYSSDEAPCKSDGTPDLSAVDFALVNHLAFWFNCDADRIDRVFRESALYRKKWDRSAGGGRTYGQRTIERACRGKTQTFVPYDRSSEREKPPLPEPPPAPRVGEEDGEKDPPSPLGPELRPDYGKYTYDDTGNAHRFRDAFYKDVKFDHIDKIWYIWNGKRWEEDQTGEVKRRADLLLEQMEDEAKRKPEEVSIPLLKLVKRTRSSRAKESMIREAQHLEGIPVMSDEFDRYKDALNVQNGVIDLRTGRLRPHSRRLMLSMLADVAFDDKAVCPRWARFLSEITEGDTVLQLYLQRMIGYCLTGSTVEQCLFFLYGSGRNGKSTFLETVSAILGDYAKTSQPETVMQQTRGNQGARSDIARLRGSRLVATSEPNEGCKLDEGLVKQMTGGGKVTARSLYRAEIEYHPEFKIIMDTNHKPIIKGTDNGIWRRVKMIPFAAQIPLQRVDHNLGEKLKQERAGILNWALAGAIGWYREGLPSCPAVDRANEEYRIEMDRLQQFIEDCLARTQGSSLQASTLFAAYRAWCEQNGERYPLSMTKLSVELQDHHGFRKQKTSRCNEYLDVDLTDLGRQMAMSSPSPHR